MYKVVTWNTKTDKVFEDYQDAVDYITMNDDIGDWYIVSLV